MFFLKVHECIRNDKGIETERTLNDSKMFFFSNVLYRHTNDFHVRVCLLSKSLLYCNTANARALKRGVVVVRKERVLRFRFRADCFWNYFFLQPYYYNKQRRKNIVLKSLESLRSAFFCRNRRKLANLAKLFGVETRCSRPTRIGKYLARTW